MANRKGPAREAKVRMNYNETALQKAIDEKVEGAAIQAAPRKIRASAPRAPSTTKAKTIPKTKPRANGGKKVTSSRVTIAKTTSQTKPKANGAKKVTKATSKKAAPIKPAEKAIEKGSSLEDHDSNTTSAETKAVMKKSIEKAPPYSKPKTSSTTKKTDETTPLSDYDTNNRDAPRTKAAVQNAIEESRKFTSINIAMPMPAGPVPSLTPSSPIKSHPKAAPASPTKTRNASTSPTSKRPSLAAAAAAPTRTAVRKPRSPNMREQRVYLKPLWSLKRAAAWERARKLSAEEKRKGLENAGAGAGAGAG